MSLCFGAPGGKAKARTADRHGAAGEHRKAFSQTLFVVETTKSENWTHICQEARDTALTAGYSLCK